MNTVAKLINTIQTMGYRVALDGDKIKLRFTGSGEPPKEVVPVILAIKEKKAFVIEYLRNVSRMDGIFKDTINELCKVYKESSMDYVSKTFPWTYKKSLVAENQINSLWDEGKDPKAFQEAVREWQDIHRKFIKLFHDKNGIAAVMGKIYNSPNGKPDPCQGLGKEEERHGTL